MIKFKPQKINVLFECNSCRDYAFAKKISQSKMLNKFYIFGRNRNASCFGEFIQIEKTQLKEFIKRTNINLFISFSEQSSLFGLIDYIKDGLKIPTVGVTRNWFYLEAHKHKGKNFMDKNGLNTPNYTNINNINELDSAILKLGFPLVIKTNILSGGFGVYIVNNNNQAINTVNKIEERLKYENQQIGICDFDNKLHIIAEEYIQGEEYTLTSLYDGKKLINFLPVIDYKRLYENDNGQNTGGLGSYMPIKLSSTQIKLISKYSKHLEKVLNKSKASFTGFISSGLLFKNDKLYILEYNMRPGDTEGQVLISNMSNDLLDLLYKTAIGKLKNTKIKYKKGQTALVVIANKNYTHKKYLLENETNEEIISKIDLSNIDKEIEIFLDSTVCYDEENCIAYSNVPERLLNLCITTSQPAEILYKNISRIKCENIYYRKDIGTFK